MESLKVSQACIDYWEHYMVENNLTVIPLDDYDPSFEEMKKDHEAGNGYVFAGGS